jgi:hypothetical protein
LLNFEPEEAEASVRDPVEPVERRAMFLGEVRRDPDDRNGL